MRPEVSGPEYARLWCELLCWRGAARPVGATLPLPVFRPGELMRWWLCPSSSGVLVQTSCRHGSGVSFSTV